MACSPQIPPPAHSSKPSFATSVDTFLSSDNGWNWKRFSANSDIEAQKTPRRRFASIRYLILNIYRRLFSLVYCANAVAFIIIMVKSRPNPLAFVNAAGINLLVCGLARHPLVVNAIFLSICRIPQSAPLMLRKRAAEAYCYGGVHSGCGVAAFLWFVGLVALMSREYWINQDSGMISLPVIVLSYVLLVVLIAIIVVAYPTFRTKRHDYFELTHRFSGWLAVALFLTLLLVFSDQARHEQGLSLGQYLLQLPAFWFVLVIIVSIVHPWLLLRRVQVLPEYLSPHAIRLHLDHTSTAFGKVIALSEHPFRDWHSFATFPDPNGRSFSCIVSKAGDWTTRCIDQQPTQLWKRGVLMYGFIHVMRVFRRVVVVATGSGIGPCLSFLSEKNRPPLRVIWQTRNPNRTYGGDVLNLVRQLDPSPLLIDTGNSGRVDMLPVIQETFREFDAEAVCVISNPRLTQKLVFELKASGVPAFGPIFDS
ncbi:hypothetical protein PENARI_c005G00883 [Penicillium arizonense]|uniref:Integral membrane protein TmpA n=1 Tax=Penicillium arizonense TaxID=1835702 RepID=A0A1F5LQ32_PENAI|nr:hypothetical protein PENARI_c005G00883 [Penicillium arizonense]OGE55130.1 hypothetical protein PENARI_c005G00883 [Penicillium arizonense]